MKSKVLAIALLATLAACSNDHYQPRPQVVAAPQPQYVEQAAPVVVQQQPQVVVAPAPVVVQQAAPAHGGDHMLTGALMGGALGYMAGRSNSGPSYVDRHPVVVNKTVVVKNYNAPKNVTVSNNTTKIAPARSFAPSPSPARLSLSKPSAPSRSFGGFSRRR